SSAAVLRRVGVGEEAPGAREVHPASGTPHCYDRASQPPIVLPSSASGRSGERLCIPENLIRFSMRQARTFSWQPRDENRRWHRCAFAAVAAAICLIGGPAMPQEPATACSLLTRELAERFSSAANEVVFAFPPAAETLPAGTACEYGDIRLQIDPSSVQQLKQLPSREEGWSAVEGVGDGAYFRSNRDTYAELAGW